MVGGNDSTEKMIHREIPRVLVLRPLATTRCSEHCSGDLSLDNAFALIEGHPVLFLGNNRRFLVTAAGRVSNEKTLRSGPLLRWNTKWHSTQMIPRQN